VSTYTGRCDVTGVVGNVVLIIFGLHTQKRKKLFENYSLFGHVPLKSFSSSVLGGEFVKNIGFKGRQIINLPGVPTCPGPAL